MFTTNGIQITDSSGNIFFYSDENALVSATTQSGTGGVANATTYGDPANTNININFVLPLNAIPTSTVVYITYTANSPSFQSELRTRMTPPNSPQITDIQSSIIDTGGTVTDAVLYSYTTENPNGNWLFEFRDTFNDTGVDTNISEIRIECAYTIATSLYLDGDFYANTLTLEEVNTPTSPLSAATIFVRNKANRRMTGQIGPSGVDYTFQPSLYGNKIAFWNPPGNATTVPGVLGMAALTAQGTATARNVTTTNLLTRAKRLSVVSNNAAGSLCGYRLGVAQYTMGNGSGAGGFMYVIRFGVSDARTATRMFIGLRNSTATPTNVEPSTITNCIGVGNGAANTNLFIYYGGSAAQTPIDLGVNFPCNTNSADLYELTLFSSPNSDNTVGYRVERLNTGNVASGVLTGVAGTALPLSTTLLTLNDFRTNNATTGAVSLDYVSIYIETDY